MYGPSYNCGTGLADSSRKASRKTLPVDLVHRAGRRLFEAENDEPPAAPTARIINLSMVCALFVLSSGNRPMGEAAGLAGSGRADLHLRGGATALAPASSCAGAGREHRMSAALTSYPAYKPSGATWLGRAVQLGPACSRLWADARPRGMESIPLQDRSKVAGVGRRKAGLNRRFPKFAGGA